MTMAHEKRRVAWLMLAGALVVQVTGCNDPIVGTGIASSGGSTSQRTAPAQTPEPKAVAEPAPAVTTPAEDTATAGQSAAAGQAAPPVDPNKRREFPTEGRAGALRISFDDLDLMKLINMDTVTPDCVEKMPAWLKELSGKKVRIRGFMKPLNVAEDLPEFPLVRSTDMCCFGPKGKVYHMIAVRLRPGLTTDYIELTPFDVEGNLRVEVEELGGLIIYIYHIDDAAIIRS